MTITVSEYGRYTVDGDVRITDSGGRELDLPYDVQLCGCGQSANYPFCDGTHATIDFTASIAN